MIGKMYVLVKLLTGQDVLGQVLDGAPESLEMLTGLWLGDDRITLVNPTLVVLVPVGKIETSGPQIGMMPYNQLTRDSEVTFHLSNIISISNPLPLLIQKHEEIYSKIKKPSSSLIMP